MKRGLRNLKIWPGIAATSVVSGILITLIMATPAHAATPDGSYILRNEGSRLCIEIVPEHGDYFANGRRMWQRTCDNQTNRPQQFWALIEVKALQYLVVNTNTNKCLDVRDGSSADRAIIQQWVCTGTSTS